MPLAVDKENNLEEYSIEKISSTHYPLLKALFLNAFELKISVEEISRRFDTLSLGLPVIGFIAIHQSTKKAAAYYGVFPCKALIGGQIVQIAQSGDTMTHEDHRRKGFFTTLAKLTYKECEKLGVKLIIGQPNQYSYHGLVNSLKWKHLDEIVRWDMKLKFKTFPLSKLFRRNRFFSPIYLRYARFILRNYTLTGISSFNNPISSALGKILRDKNYIDYKRSDDKFFIKIDDVVIWTRLTDILWIGDFDNYEKITPEVLEKLKRLAFWLGYNTISFNFNETIPLPAALRSFKKYNKQASCFYYLDQSLNGLNFILTAADSDTW